MGLRDARQLEKNAFHLFLPFIALAPVELPLFSGNYDSANKPNKIESTILCSTTFVPYQTSICLLDAIFRALYRIIIYNFVR